MNDIASPSTLDDRCRRLHDGIPSVQNTTVHLFDENEIYVTTCYPEFDAVSKNPKGLCQIHLRFRALILLFKSCKIMKNDLYMII